MPNPHTHGQPNDECRACQRNAGWSTPQHINGQRLVRCLGCGEYAIYLDPPKSANDQPTVKRPPLPPVQGRYRNR